MNIRDVMTQVVAIQESLTITDPASASVLKAWPCAPPFSVTLADTPACINEWTLDPGMGSKRTTQGLREQYYTVHMQLLVDAEADYDVAADMASAFMGALVDAFDATETLNGSCSWSKLRGANPTLAPMRRNDHMYAGLDLFLDVRLTEGKTYGL